MHGRLQVPNSTISTSENLPPGLAQYCLLPLLTEVIIDQVIADTNVHQKYKPWLTNNFLSNTE